MTTPLHWQCNSFEQLSGAQLYAILQARCDVFIMEQQCIYPDVDGADLSTLHLSAWTADGQLAAYLRIHAPGSNYPEASIGRVLTTRAFRRGGIGRQLVAEGVRQIYAHYPGHAVTISAQLYLLEFYRSFGFVSVDQQYLEDGIPHIQMCLPAP